MLVVCLTCGSRNRENQASSSGTSSDSAPVLTKRKVVTKTKREIRSELLPQQRSAAVLLSIEIIGSCVTSITLPPQQEPGGLHFLGHKPVFQKEDFS